MQSNWLVSFLVCSVANVAALEAGASDNAVVAKPRRAEEKKCSPQTVAIMRPTALVEFQACVSKGQREQNMTLVGAGVALQARCFCESNMKVMLEDYNCCEHPNFKAYCDMECDADCASEDAKKCYQECPALCLEEAYAPEGCNCKGCYQYLRCIAKRGMERTHSGELDTVCHDIAFEQSYEVRQWMSCMGEHPLRTNWDRHNSRHHCACKAGVKNVAEEHSCCGANWAKSLCDGNCASEVDCQSSQAKSCVQLCDDACPAFLPQNVSDACRTLCLNEGAKCAEYRSCKPNPIEEFDYICDDMQKPMKNGCCSVVQGLYEYHVCPQLCETHTEHIMPHGVECVCGGCPRDKDEHAQAINDTIISQIEESGEIAEREVLRMAGLDKPTERMKELLEARNAELKAILALQPGEGILARMTRQQALAATNDLFNRELMMEAQRTAECRRRPDSIICTTTMLTTSSWPKVEDNSGAQAGTIAGPDDKDNSDMMLVIIIIVSVTAFLVIIGGIFALFRFSKRSSFPPQSSVDGANVVVGRPVDGQTAGPPPQFAGTSNGTVVAGQVAGGNGCPDPDAC